MMCLRTLRSSARGSTSRWARSSAAQRPWWPNSSRTSLRISYRYFCWCLYLLSVISHCLTCHVTFDWLYACRPTSRKNWMGLDTLTWNSTSRTSMTFTPGNKPAHSLFHPHRNLSAFNLTHFSLHIVQDNSVGHEAHRVQPGLRQAHLPGKADKKHFLRLSGKLHWHGERVPPHSRCHDPAEILRLQEPSETPDWHRQVRHWCPATCLNND